MTAEHPPPRPAQRVDWEQYEVPQIWQMVQGEDDPDAAAMVMEFNKIAQYADDACERLTRVADRLDQSWSGSAAAGEAQARLRRIIDALRRDAAAYATATQELNNIIDRLAEAKRAIKPINDRWTELHEGIKQTGVFSHIIAESEFYQDTVEQANVDARTEMRRLDRDLSDAKVTVTEEYQPPPGPPPADMHLAGLGPRAVAAAHGGYAGPPLLPAAAEPPLAPAGVPVPIQQPVRRPATPGVIGAPGADRPVTGAMMGGGMGAGAHRGGGGTGSGRADQDWQTRTGVDAVIDGVPPPDPRAAGAGGVIGGPPESARSTGDDDHRSGPGRS